MIETDKKFQIISETNSETYTYSKLIEELFELGEVLSKKINKSGGDKEPPIEKIIEELGDVVLRISLLSYKLNIVQEIEDRMEYKVNHLFDYFLEGKYIGKL